MDVSAFPPAPRSFHGREGELRTLARAIRELHPARIALVGAGGSGKSTLACALGHRLERSFRGEIHWFRTGAWDVRTLVSMASLRLFGRRMELDELREALSKRRKRFIVLDNHESDGAVAELLDGLTGAPVTFVITARRCLLSGVSIHPVIPPLITSRALPFPRIAKLTRALRWNPVGLAIADAIVRRKHMTAAALGAWLEERGLGRVVPLAHEDDLPEVKLLVLCAIELLSPAARRAFAALAHSPGDHLGVDSLAALARTKTIDRALRELRDLSLMQELLPGRYALHATVSSAAREMLPFDAARHFSHFMKLLKRHPERFDLEQTHLFAAMDYAQDRGTLRDVLAVDELVDRLERQSEERRSR